jgi:TorA maturation chaperone TorD/Fe-S-cluster-containing hydrogenase component 2
MGALRQAQKNPQDIAGQPDSTARARAMIYHALAEALADPIPGVQELLLEAVTIGAQVLDSVACQKTALTLAKLPTTNLEALRRSYTRLIANPGRRPLVLYESLYRGSGLMGQITWEVEQYYRALGLALVKGELPDHASVELAFLGHLATAETTARAVGDGQLIARLRAEQDTFLRAHAGAWLPEVGVALASAVADNRFYTAVGRLLSEFLAEEMTGRKQNGRTRVRLPTLKDPDACTLCGLCVGSCPLDALRVIESATETVLTLNPAHCIGCNRCGRTCPEGVLLLSSTTWPDSRFDPASGAGYRVMRQSPRLECPNCGRPTVSRAELDAVLARLQPDPVVQQRLYLCIECKSWSM